MSANPYESPKTATPTGHARRPLDIGRFVGRYLQVLACLSLVSMIVDAVFFDQLIIDLSFVFLFWAGAYLISHSTTARTWVVGISGLAILVCLAIVVYAVTFGPEGIYVSLWRPIDNPSLGQVLGVASFLGIIAGIPFVLLLTSQAKREFIRVPRAE